jgi:hypothetical protein
MQLTAAEIAFLQRLVAERPPKRQNGTSAVSLMQEHRIGRAAGRSIEYTAGDFERAERLLKNAGQSLIALAPGATRAEMAGRVGVTEKSGAARPHSNSIAWKPAAGQVRMGSGVVQAFGGGYQVSTVEDACAVEADVLMVVENLESLRWIERSTWIDYQGKSVMAIFRGDAQFSNADVKRLLDAREEDVWVFSDFDPAGLWIAASVPRVKRLVLPEATALEIMTKKAKRFDLFVDQLKQYRSVLDSCQQNDIERAWSLMKRLQAGLPQEWMLNTETRN